VLETHLGWAAHSLGFRALSPVFDGADNDAIEESLCQAWLAERSGAISHDPEEEHPLQWKKARAWLDERGYDGGLIFSDNSHGEAKKACLRIWLEDQRLEHEGLGDDEVEAKAQQSAWESGDPGILFIDRINRANPTPEMGVMEATNPCGEQPLLPYESCTLGSINLTRILSDGCIDYPKLESLVHLAVHFLDNVVEVNRHPIARTEEWSRMNRKIGLGVMGFADMLIRLGIPYQSERAVVLAEQIMSCIQQAAEAASADLAARRGNFPAFQRSVFPGRGVKRRRNATLTTVAPTGTISLLAGVSSSVEPVFALETQRRIADQRYTDVHPLYDQYRREGRTIDPMVFQTAWDIAPRWHLKIQAAFQKYTDNAVSKTVNLPETISVEEIRDLFLQAAAMNLKGVTVYRDQSHPDQILSACSLRSKECC